jgi:hypothetical protein
VTTAVVAYLLGTGVLVAIGVLWIVSVGRRGDANRYAGKIDGVLSLGFLFFTLCAVVMIGAAFWRVAELRRIHTTWQPVDAVVVTNAMFRPMQTFNPTVYHWDSRTGQFTSDWLGLETAWRYTAPGGLEREVTTRTCCTSSQPGFADWEAWYRPGSRHRLFVNPYDRTAVRIDYAATPVGETGPRAAAEQAFRFTVVATALYAIARWIVARRREAAPF